MKLTPYEDREYEGELNLLKAERYLIIKAWSTHKGDYKRMCAELDLSGTALLIKIIRHKIHG